MITQHSRIHVNSYTSYHSQTNIMYKIDNNVALISFTDLFQMRGNVNNLEQYTVKIAIIFLYPKLYYISPLGALV